MRWSPLVVGVLAILAGCQAPVSPAEPSATTAPPPSVEPTGPADRLAPDVPLSKNRTFERLAAVLNLSGTRPRVLIDDVSIANRTRRSDFRRVMGISNPVSIGNGTASAVTLDGYTVRLEPADASLVGLEALLVHEYVHALQIQHRLPAVPTFGPQIPTDKRYAIRGMLEGGAVWATDAYLERYRPNVGREHVAMARRWNRSAPADALFIAPYHFGQRYVDGRIDDPAAFRGAYRTVPDTTEQLIHGEEPSAEPPAPVAVEPANTYKVIDTDRKGELLVRVILRTELPSSRAERAAAGWGGDRVAKILLDREDERYGYVWALRWDTPADAEEFAAAFRAYVDRRSATAVGFRLERLDEETTVVLVGPSTFVEAARVDGTAARVRVAPAS